MRAEEQVDAPTEERNPGTALIDAMDTVSLLETINDNDALVAQACRAVIPDLAQLVDRAALAVRAGRVVHYFGAGTSGRLAVLDAAELRPTFNAPDGMVVAHMAGGEAALLRAQENVEDDLEQGGRDAADVRAGDIVIGITASGRTPYVAGALRVARVVAATTALVTSNPTAEIAAHADYLLAAVTGPEVVTGSTRMKAGTSQKLILNAFSTALMIRLGRTYSNLMVDVVATNAKLRGRVIRILCEASGADEGAARAALEASDGELKPALLSLLAGLPAPQARALLDEHGGSVAAVLAIPR